VDKLHKTTILVDDKNYIRMKKLLAEDHQSFSKWIRDKINEELARSDDKDLAE
jgi:hypothetical protein